MGNEPKMKILYLKGLKLSSWCQILMNFTSMKGRSTPMPSAEHAGSVCYSPKTMILFQKNLNPVSPEVQHPLFGVKSRIVHSFKSCHWAFLAFIAWGQVGSPPQSHLILSSGGRTCSLCSWVMSAPITAVQCWPDIKYGHSGYSWKLG